jgi:alkylated DNA repair protein (DNA oxidative demethylase)
MQDLFSASNNNENWLEPICKDAVVLRQFALKDAEALLLAAKQVIRQAPFRQMQTPGGRTISVALTACGEYGWVSDQYGYRYSKTDPLTNTPWPAAPSIFYEFARKVADKAGFPDFVPDACLINRYLPGTKMSLHQDKNEKDFSAPIVSVSLGVPAMFLFGGMERSDKTVKIPLIHGDVVVWGGDSRLKFHGVNTLKDDYHPLTGNRRINITFRKAG